MVNISAIDKAIKKFNGPMVNLLFRVNLIMLLISLSIQLYFKFANALKSFNFNIIFKPVNKLISNKSRVLHLCKRIVYSVSCKILSFISYRLNQKQSQSPLK